MKKLTKIMALAVAVAIFIFVTSGCSFIQEAIQDTRNAIVEGITEGQQDGDREGRIAEIGEIVPEDYERRIIPFEEMEYVRPDISDYSARMNAIADEIAAAEEFEQVEELFFEADELVGTYYTMYVLANIYSSQDKSDEYWIAEERYCSENTASLTYALKEFYNKLYESKWKERFEEEDEYFFDVLEDLEYVNDETQPLIEREAVLISEYQELLVTGAIEHRGKEYTYSDIVLLEDVEEIYDVLEKWYLEYNDVLGNIYVELVSLRNEMATMLGYENYIDFALDQKGSDYSAEMMQELIDEIEQYIVPVQEELLGVGLFYYPDAEVSLGEFKPFARKALNSLSPSLAETFDVMEENSLYDFEPGLYKESGAFTTYLYDYDAPFMFGTYEDDATSMTTFIHEFGHFNDYYYTLDSFAETLDTAEVFSQTLELLFSSYYEDEFGMYTGYEMKYDVLSSAFQTFLSQPYYTSLEMRAYELSEEELSIEAINAISQEECTRFSMNGFGLMDFSEYDWVLLPHMFETPFYTFSYVVAQDVALQIWQVSLTDEATAIEIYYDLLAREQSEDFIENVVAAGLESPFEQGRMQEVAMIGKRYLVDENW